MTPDEEVRALKVSRQVMMRCVGDEDYDKRLADIAHLHPARLAVVNAACNLRCAETAGAITNEWDVLRDAVDALLTLESTP